MGNLFSFYDLYPYKLQVSNLARKPRGTRSSCSLRGVGRVERRLDCDGTYCACAAHLAVPKRSTVQSHEDMERNGQVHYEVVFDSLQSLRE
jgi:hypothetical protein